MLGVRLRQPEQRAIQASPWGVWQGEEYAPTWSGSTVTNDTSVQLSAVYGSVTLIVDSISTLPLDVFRKLFDGSRQGLPLPPWLVNPVPGMSRVAWLSQVLSSLLLDGNGYIGVKRNPAGQLVELPVIPDSQVDIRRENGSPVLYVDGRVPDYQVIHIPALLFAGCEKGLAPIEAARQTIGLGLGAVEYGARFFGQGATMSGVIEHPGELLPDKARELASAWARRHSGPRKAHLPGVLEGGAHWVATGVTNEQAQFLETRGYTAAEIAGQIYKVDPSDLGIPVNGTSLTYANLTERNERRIQVTLLPWIVRIEEALSRLLAAPRYVKFNVDGLRRGDTKTRYDSYGVAIDKGFLTVNEVRELEDRPPLPEDEAEPGPPDLEVVPEGGESNAA